MNTETTMNAFLPVDDAMMTVRDAARHFQVSATTIRRWVKAGKVKSVQPGGSKGAIRIAK